MKNSFTKHIVSLFLVTVMIITSLSAVTVVSADAPDLTKDYVSTYVAQTAAVIGSDSLIRTKAGQDLAYMLRNSNDFSGRNSSFVNTDATENITYFDGVTKGYSTVLQKHANASSDTTDANSAIHGTSLATAESSSATPRTWFDKSSLKAGDKLLVSIYVKTVEEGKTTKANIALSNQNMTKATSYTDKYGSTGMEVTDEWKQLTGIITLPEGFSADDKYTLHFGFAQNTKMEKMYMSCIYAAKVSAAKFSLTLGETSLEPGGKTTAKASLTNQAGTTDGLSEDFTWYVTNSDRTQILTDSGITIVKSENSANVTINVSENTKNGTYCIVAVAKSGEIKGQMIEVGGIDPNMTKLDLYVSPSGNNSNTGSIDAPFKTLEKARDYIRNFKKRDIPITVFLRGGEYVLENTLELNSKDGGSSESAPVTYKAYNGENVVITGSKSYDMSKFAPITGDMKDYLSGSAKDKVVAAKGQSIGLSPIDVTITDSTFALSAPLMMIDNNSLELSRYPNSDSNEDWLIGQPVNPQGGNNTVPVVAFPDEIKLFDMSYRTEDFVYHGYIAWGWAANFFKGTPDKNTKTVTGTTSTYYGITQGNKKPVHVYNSFEAIDQPGEWYYDKSSDMLYIYPFDNTDENSKLYITNASFDLISANGTKNLNIEGIRLTSSKRSAVKLNNTDNVTINNCTINNFSNTAVYADNSTNFILENSLLHQTALNAVYVNGGNFDTFEPSGNRITNNVIHNTARYKQFNIPAVSIRGVEPHVDHNEFYNIPLVAVMFSGAGDTVTSVNSVIEYNKFHECCINAVDLSVIYGGRDFRALGTKIRYNHFYNISNNMDAYGFAASAVFGDDATSGIEITHNIVGPGCNGENTEAFKINWGHDNVISQNLIIDLPAMFYMYKVSNFAEKVAGELDAKFGSTVGPTLPMCWDNVNYQTNWPWVKAFKENKGYYVPNEISKNVHIFIDNYPHTVSGWSQFDNSYYVYNNGKVGSDEPDIEGFTTNLVVKKTKNSGNKDLFVDFDGGNYNLKPETLAKVEGFENIDQSKIGTYEFEYENKKYIPGGSKPVASDVEISGLAKIGKTITAKYNFSDADGHKNRASHANFYLLDKEDETYYLNYKKLSDNTSLNDFKITEECEGKWIKCKVTPIDENGTYGEPVWSDTIYVEPSGSADKDELYTLVQEVKEFIGKASVGTEAGQYPQAEADLINAALSSAEKILGDANTTQFAVNNEKSALEKSFKRFKDSCNIAENVTRINIAPFIADKDAWTTKGTNYAFENNSLKLSSGYEWATYNKSKFKNTEFSFRYKQNTSAWSGIYFAQEALSEFPWSSTGILVCFKPDCAELQVRDGIKSCSEAEGTMYINKNIGFENDKTYNVTLGMYDVSSSSVRLYMTVDGEKVFDVTHTSTALVSKEGYFGIIAAPNSVATLSGSTVDKTGLKAILDEAKAVLDNAVAGTDYNQYSETDIADFKAVYDDSKSVYDNPSAVSDTVGKAEYLLEDALNTFRKLAVTTKNFTADGSVKLNCYTDKSVFTVSGGINAAVTDANNKLLPEIESTSNGVSMLIKNGTTLKNQNWDGTLKLPVITSEASGKTGSLKADKVYSMGAPYALTSDAWIKIVLKDAKDENIAYRTETGSYKNISTKEGNEPMYKTAEENDAVIYTKLLTELITYKTVGNTENGNNSGSSDNGGNSNNGGISGGSHGSTNGNNFYVGSVTTPENAGTFIFDDMINHWAKTDVISMYKSGIVSGVSETMFDPDRNITRAEFAAIIARALSLTDRPANYDDVDSEDWFAGYVGACSDAGIISGFDGKFRPNDNITREEMAVVIVNAYSYLDKPAKSGGIDNFTDKDEISDWAKEAVDAASAAGLISGMGDGTYQPQANATRAQAASIVKRLLDK